ncbi:two-component response regulator ARR12-like protein [Tanacetum coccineum]
MSDSQSYSQNSQRTDSYGVLNERSYKTLQERSFKVLVVGEKKDDVYAIASLLHSHSYQVTCIHNAYAALKLLSEKENEYDLLIVDREITNVDIHTFLRSPNIKELLSIVMSEEGDDDFLVEAFKSGAFLVLKKPLTIDVIRLIHQDVIREKMPKHEKCKNKTTSVAKRVGTDLQESRSCESKRKERGYPKKDDITSYEFSEDNDVCDILKKNHIAWTRELHTKFISATRQLGEGRCYPMEILKLMNVPGLTRMQVASHLQRCRGGRWEVKENRQVFVPSRSRERENTIKHGRMPSTDEDRSSKICDLTLSLNGCHTEANLVTNQSVRGSTMMNGSSPQNTAGQGSIPDTYSSNQQAYNGFINFL